MNVHLPSALVWAVCILLCSFNLQAQTDAAALTARLDSVEGEERLEVLLDAANRALDADNSTGSVIWASRALTEAREQSNAKYIAKASVLYGRALFSNSEYEATVQAMRVAEVDCEAIGDFALVAEANLYQGKAYNLQAKYDSAEMLMSNGLALARKIGDKHLQGLTLDQLGRNARYQSDYALSAQYHFQALAIWEALKDSFNIAEAMTSIGILYYYQDENVKALEQFQRCMDYWQQQNDSASIGFSYTLMALANFRLNNHDVSIEQSLKSLEIRKALGDLRGQGESLNNLALAHMAQQHWSEALSYLDASLLLLESAGDERQRPILLSNMGTAKYELGHVSEAILYYQESLHHARVSDNKSSIQHAYKRLHKAFATNNQYDSAYHYHRLFKAMTDSIYNEEKTRAINELTIQYEAAQTEQENALLRQEAANKDQRDVIIAISGGLGILMLLTIVVLLVQRIKRSKQVFAAQQQLTEAKLVNTQQELDYHRNKLTDYTRNLLEKNRILEELQDQLAEAEAKAPVSEQQLPNLLDLKILTDSDWDNFKRLFENVHTGFHGRLRARHADLSEGEQRLFLLLRLNLNTREIANILGVAPDSVKKARYRLRKKLALKEEENLQAFVAAF